MKLLTALLSLFLLGACTDPITVGSDLLGEDRTGVGETTDIPFTTTVVEEDSLWVLNGTNATYVQGPAFSFGQIDEPTFGLTTHSAYLAPRLTRNASGVTVIPPFARQINLSVDSVVLLIPIDTVAGIYGPGREFPYRALEIAEPIEVRGTNYYSDFTQATLPEDLGYSASFTVSLNPIPVRDTLITSPEVKQPHARIRLSDGFANRIQNLGATSYEYDSVFQQVFPGVYLVPSAPSEALVNFAPIEPQNVTPYGGFNVYYTDSTGNPAFYRMPLQVVLPNYAYDYSNALVEPLLDEEVNNDLVALAGKGSLMTEITFGDLSEWEGKVINRAVLEIPVADVEGVTYDKYPRPSRLELFYKPDPDGPLIAIQDKVELIRTGFREANSNFFLDGNLRTEGDLSLYTVSFSLQMQRIIDGEVPNRLYLRVYPIDAADYGSTQATLFEPVSAKDAARALLNGPQAANNPARIRMTFTELD